MGMGQFKEQPRIIWENGPKTLLYHLKEITAVVDTEKNKIIYPDNCKLKRRNKCRQNQKKQW